MMLLYFNSEKGMNYYYSNETQQIYAMKIKEVVGCKWDWLRVHL